MKAHTAWIVTGALGVVGVTGTAIVYAADLDDESGAGAVVEASGADARAHTDEVGASEPADRQSPTSTATPTPPTPTAPSPPTPVAADSPDDPGSPASPMSAHSPVSPASPASAASGWSASSGHSAPSADSGG